MKYFHFVKKKLCLFEKFSTEIGRDFLRRIMAKIGPNWAHKLRRKWSRTWCCIYLQMSTEMTERHGGKLLQLWQHFRLFQFWIKISDQLCNNCDDFNDSVTDVITMFNNVAIIIVVKVFISTSSALVDSATPFLF